MYASSCTVENRNRLQNSNWHTFFCLRATREIEEETGVKAQLKDKICTTWHTYTLNNNRILKRTKWYLFDCADDSKMAPQAEEQIEKLEWCNPEKVKSVLVNSYSSIRFVVDSLKTIQSEK